MPQMVEVKLSPCRAYPSDGSGMASSTNKGLIAAAKSQLFAVTTTASYNQIKWHQDPTKCLQLPMNHTNGAKVTIGPCIATPTATDPYDQFFAVKTKVNDKAVKHREGSFFEVRPYKKATCKLGQKFYPITAPQCGQCLSVQPPPSTFPKQLTVPDFSLFPGSQQGKPYGGAMQ